MSRRSKRRPSDLLAGLDRGDYAAALAFVDASDEAPDDVADALLRAEAALYRDRYDEAAEYLDRLASAEVWIDDEGDLGSFARRSRLVRVEHACFTGNLHEAERLLRPLLAVSARVGDTQVDLRALYDAARIARHRADWPVAIDRLEAAEARARALGNRFYEGRVAYTLGYCWYFENRFDLAVPYLQAALALLEETENLRFRATAQSFYGCLLGDRGELQEALELLERAERTAGELGIVGDMVTARMNTARTHLAMGRYDDVERELTDLLRWERPPGGTPIELMTLRLLAIAECVRGRIPEARRAAEEALRLAQLWGNDLDRLEARLLVARARSLAGEETARDELEALVAEADARATPYLRAEARIYAARAFGVADPAKASALRDAARAMPVVDEYIWLRRELDMLDLSVGSAPVSVDGDGRLVMDARLGWPDLKTAREATERYWFERALEASSGNVSAASRLLGLTRNEGQYLHHILMKEGPPRPSRSRNPEAATRTARRRPTSRG